MNLIVNLKSKHHSLMLTLAMPLSLHRTTETKSVPRPSDDSPHLHGDDALLADALHGTSNQLADLLVTVCRNGPHLHRAGLTVETAEQMLD